MKREFGSSVKNLKLFLSKYVKSSIHHDVDATLNHDFIWYINLVIVKQTSTKYKLLM